MELESWQNIIHTDDWRVFLKLLETHKSFLQKEVNDCLRKHEDRKAVESLRALDDCNKIIGLVTTTIAGLRSKIETEK